MVYPPAVRAIHSILYNARYHLQGHLDSHPTWPHFTEQYFTFNRILPIRPTSCACPALENHRKKSFSYHSKLSREHPSLSHLYLVRKEPGIHIGKAALDAWKIDQLANAEALLSAAMPTSKGTAHILANRALVLARLQQWDAALVDAERVHFLSFVYTLIPI